MTIVRCIKCGIVLLDSYEDGEREVECQECGSHYKIELQQNRVKSLVSLSEVPEDYVQPHLAKDSVKLDTVIYERQGKIAKIILNRPEKLNAMSANMRWDIVRCIDMLEKDDNVSVGIIKGNGRAFSAGGDLGGVYSRYGGGTRPDGRSMRPSQRARLWVDESNGQFVVRVSNCWKPLICQTHGYCLGWGLILSNACDITITADDCLFGHPEQRQAFGGGVSVAEILLLGYKKAREMSLLGTKVDGKEAERIGWVNRSVPADQLETEVEKVAEAISMMPRDALAIGKVSTLMSLEALGVRRGIASTLLHTMATNLRFEPDEMNFIRERSKQGTTKAIHKRDEAWEKKLK